MRRNAETRPYAHGARGAVPIEYVLIVLLVGVLAAAAFRLLGHGMSDGFDRAAETVQNAGRGASGQPAMSDPDSEREADKPVPPSQDPAPTIEERFGLRTLDPQGDYVVYKVNNEVEDWFKGIGTDKPTDSFASHSFLAVYDRKTGRVIETYSFVNTNGGSWENPLRGQNMRGAEAAIDLHLGTKKWCAKEMARGGTELIEAYRDEFARRCDSPARYSLPHWNCKHETTDLCDAVTRRLKNSKDSPGVADSAGCLVSGSRTSAGLTFTPLESTSKKER